jgi:DNA-binding beta-propeller fold protein YncE
VLDNCDSDYKSPPFNDVVLFLNNKGEVVNRINGLNVCQNIGGNRAISVSEDRRFFVVCENVADKITAYDLLTGDEIWSLSGKFRSTAIAQGITYVLTFDNTIYGDGILAVDSKGNIIKQSKRVGGFRQKNDAEGFDIVVDPNTKCIWLVGGDIKKCSMDLKVIKIIDPITWCAVSVDIAPDGSIWVAEREHIEETGSQNRLLNISPKGNISQVIPLNDLSPSCVRVNKSNGNVWVTGKRFPIRRRLTFRQWPPWRRTYGYIGPRTRKYSSKAKLLLEIKRGGHSIDIDPSDGSVWIADPTQLLHYSSEGKKLNTCNDVFGDQKWITIVK